MELPVTTPEQPSTLKEYLELDRTSPIRHEFYGYKIVAMAGGRANHGRICHNFASEMRNRLLGQPCETFNGETRIKVLKSERFFYADASAVCGGANFVLDGGNDSLTNPQVLVEVLSPTTERFDWNYKFDQYTLIESLREFVLIEQDEPRVTILRRQPGKPWTLVPVIGLDESVRLESLGIDIPMKLIFMNVEFPPKKPSDAQTT